MSTFDSDDLGTKGYFLPEDSQLRLKQLGEYVTFLSNLARPRRPDEDMEGYAEIRPGDVAICLELLAEQVEAVLGELSYPAERGATLAADEVGATVEAEPDVSAVTGTAADTDATEPASDWPPANEAGERYVAGVTLAQIDELYRLGDILRAHGDVVVATDQADFADVTLSIMGDAIIRDSERLGEIIRDLDGVQRLEPPHGTKPGVRETWATYLALPAPSPPRSTSHVVRQHPTCQ
jgi:hypothetical protein